MAFSKMFYIERPILAFALILMKVKKKKKSPGWKMYDIGELSTIIVWLMSRLSVDKSLT